MSTKKTQTKEPNTTQGSDAVISNDEEQRAIQRLRDSELEYQDAMIIVGERAGNDYVLRIADYPQMQRLENWTHNDFWDLDVSNGLKISNVASVMTANDGSGEDLEVTLREEYGAYVDDSSWLTGFICTAVSKFRELKSKL